MGGIFGDQIPLFLRHGLTLTASSIDKLQHIDRIAGELGVTATVHLKIDTGMERIGIHYYNARGLLERAAECRHCDVEGIYSHFAGAPAPALVGAPAGALHSGTREDGAPGDGGATRGRRQKRGFRRLGVRPGNGVTDTDWTPANERSSVLRRGRAAPKSGAARGQRPVSLRDSGLPAGPPGDHGLAPAVCSFSRLCTVQISAHS